MSLNYSELFWIISKTISKKTSRRLSPVLWRSQSVVCWCQICTRDFFQIFWCIFSWWLEVEASRGSCMALAEMVCCKDRKKFVWNQRKNRKQDSSKIRISCLPWSILKAIRCLARPSIPGQGRKNDGSPKGFGMEDSIFAVGGIFFWMFWYFSAVKRICGMFAYVLECCSISQTRWWVTLWWVTPTFQMITLNLNRHRFDH